MILVTDVEWPDVGWKIKRETQGGRVWNRVNREDRKKVVARSLAYTIMRKFKFLSSSRPLCPPLGLGTPGALPSYQSSPLC